MTFELIEQAVDLGKPVKLYKFTRSTLQWAYCSADRDITYLGIKYKALVGGISDNGTRTSGQATADAFEITAPASVEVAQLYRGIGPSDAVEITVYEMHFGDTDAIIGYMGKISGVKFPQRDRCQIICNTDSLEQTGLRFTWGRGCGYTWGDHNCGVNRELYKLNTTIQSMDGLIISSADFSAFASGWFAGGEIEWPVAPGVYDRRGIVSHTGSTIELLGGTNGLSAGQAIAAFPSCSRNWDTCTEFANTDNYGGQRDQPGKSPFNGEPIF